MFQKWNVFSGVKMMEVAFFAIAMSFTFLVH